MEYENKSVVELRSIARQHGYKGTQTAMAGKQQLLQWLSQDAKPVDSAEGAGNNGSDLATVIAHAIQGKLQLDTPKGVDVEEVRNIIKEELATLAMPKRIEIGNVITGQKVDVGIQHNIFEDVLKLAQLRLNTMLVGPAGSGKTTICHTIANALSLPFYFQAVGQQTTKTDLLGYMDATGKYIATHLRNAYENGGVFLLDEVDAGNANVLTVLNSMLANSAASFPDKLIPAHKDFIFICSANTYGRGSDRNYVGRTQLDAATLDRFIVVDMDYDETLEKAICTNTQWLEKVLKIRKIVRDLGEKVVVSPRASIYGSLMLANGFSETKVMEMIIWKGANKDVRAKIETRL